MFFSFCMYLNSCDEYTIKKNDTKAEYKSFLVNYEKQLDVIVEKCYQLKIEYITSDSLNSIIKEDSLKAIVNNIEYLKFNDLPDYKSYDLKLKIKENKCVDFFLTKPLVSKINNTSWDIKIIDKSPCF